MNPSRDTPYTIALSHNEVIALVKYHTAQAKALPKKVGAISMSLAKENGGTPKALDIKALHKEAKEILDFHTGRARGLLSILPRRTKG